MSQMEYNKGELIPVKKSFKDIYEECCGAGATPPYGTYEEYIRDDFGEFGYVVIKDKPYKIQWDARAEELYEFADVEERSDGVVEFSTYHYNGGAHWTEVVEGEL